MIYLIIGIIIGGAFGVMIMALLQAARETEPPKQGKHEPAKLWTKGNLCRYKGDTYVIYSMETDEQNQTTAILGNGHDAVIAPIEKLEAVEG